MMKSRWGLATLVFTIGLMMLSGCLKDEDNGLYQVSAVRALNAIPGSDQLDVALNESWLNYVPETDEVEDFAYRDTLPYKRAWPGIRAVRVFERGETTSNGLLVQKNVQFVPGQFYSLYVVGVEDDVELMLTEDDLTEPAAGKAKIRFINLSPDAPALDFGVDDADTLIATDIAFKKIKDFSAVGSDEMYTFNIIEHSSGDVVHSFEFRPESNRIYTVWVGGLFENEGNTDLSFGHGIIIH